MTDIPRCVSCRHWDGPDIGQEDRDLRVCARIPYGRDRKPDDPAYVDDAESNIAWILTRADFGCTLHEPI